MQLSITMKWREGVMVMNAMRCRVRTGKTMDNYGQCFLFFLEGGLKWLQVMGIVKVCVENYKGKDRDWSKYKV